MHPELEALNGAWIELMRLVGIAFNLIAAGAIVTIGCCALLQYAGSRADRERRRAAAVPVRPRRVRAARPAPGSRVHEGTDLNYIFKYLFFPRTRGSLLPRRLHKK